MRYKINFACWNVRTLLDADKSKRPERRTALVTRELKRLNIDIAALSETRLAEEDQLKEEGSGYSLFWVGKRKGERRDGGVGFAIKSTLLDQIERPAAINDRIMKLRIPLSCGRHLSVFSVYAPTLQASEEISSAFYRALTEAIFSVPKDEKLIILGDFNARVGKDWETWNALGHHGIGNINNNGLRLLEFCSEQSLMICNTVFRQKEKHKTTWTHPRSKQGHLIDFIITRKRDLADASSVRVMRSAECDTDHRLVRGKFKLRIRKKVRMAGVQIPKRIDVEKLKHPLFLEAVNDKLDSLVFDGSWLNYKDQIYSVGTELLGFKKRKNQDWFDENDQEISKLLQEKRRLYENVLGRHQQEVSQKAYKKIKATLQRELRQMKNKWWTNLASEIQLASDRKDAKTMYALLHQVFGPTSSSVVPLKAKDNTTLIKDPSKILDRWQEHFQDLFYNPSVVDESVIDNLPQFEIKHRMDRIPTLEEVDIAVKQLSSGKAPVHLPVELIKTGSETVRQATLNLILGTWGGNIPQDWIDGILFPLYKSKGEKSICDHYRGITLLESVGKVLARLLLSRLLEDICPITLPESQCGFRSERGCVDMVFSARQIQEKCIEQQMPLYQVFVDLTKAFDTVNREALWKVLSKLGCPPTFLHMIKELHRNMKGRVAFNGKLSNEISIENGVKQGDIPAPTLFSIYFAVLLMHAFKDCEVGVMLQFRTSGKVFNLRRMNAKSKVSQDLIRELLYADDADFLAHSEADMQIIMNKFSNACDAFGLKISLKKTKVMFTPSPAEPYNEPNITVNGQRLDVVDTFVYLGSNLSRDGNLDAEIFVRIQKAAVAFGKLEKRVWSNRDITIRTKVDVYRTCVITTLLYAAETWTTHQRHIKLLEHFHLKCLRRILNIKWQTYTPDIEVLKRASCANIESMITASQLRWAGHLVRMSDDRIPKRLFYGELVNGKRPQHKPRKRYKDGLKNILMNMDIDHNTWEETALNRNAWRKSVWRGCGLLHDKRVQKAKLKRELRKGNTDNLPNNIANWTCRTCGRVLLSRAGYVNHLKSHEERPSTHTIPPRPDSTTCVVCMKVCKSESGLKRHMVVHKDAIHHPDPINHVKTVAFVCHICYRSCKSAAGLRSHLRAHGRTIEIEEEQ